MESNITRDHLAMEAMKILLGKSLVRRIYWTNRLKKILGMKYSVTTCFIHNPKNISETSYEMADAMITERERKEQ